MNAHYENFATENEQEISVDEKKEILNNMFKDEEGDLASRLVASLLKKSSEKEAKLTPEEREKIKQKNEVRKEKNRVINCIIANKCPDDDGHLTRGKKDKNNDYKRPFTCDICGKVWYRDMF